VTSRRKEKQERKAERQASKLPLDLKVEPAGLGQPRIMCTACKENGREACTLYHIIECQGECVPPCGGDHLALICSACGERSSIMAEDLIASMHWPEVCSTCGKVFDHADGGGVGTSIGAPPGVEEIFYCKTCFSGVSSKL